MSYRDAAGVCVCVCRVRVGGVSGREGLERKSWVALHASRPRPRRILANYGLVGYRDANRIIPKPTTGQRAGGIWHESIT